jgi:predicted AAA+ superfamily ATPase
MKMTSKEIYITREIEGWIKTQSQHYPILSVMGPRQSGKTEMIRQYFPHLPYYDLEESDNFEMISKNPNRFVRDNCMEGAIFDEFHYIPEMTQILKTIADELRHQIRKEGKTALPTRFILTGSHNYLFDDNIKETMTGRAAIIKLMPFTLQESKCTDAYEAMYKGGYPILYVNGETPQTFFPPYIQNYLDKEVLNIHGIKDLLKFREFMQICASLVGNFFDYETVGSALSLSRKKLDEWLMVLYSSCIIFFARPYNRSLIKQMSKNHKLYFHDTGLAASLIDVQSSLDIEENPDAKGKLFENLVFGEMWKKNFIKGRYLDGSPPRHPVRSTGSPGEFVQSVNDNEEVLHYTSSMQNDDFNGMVIQRAGKIKKAIEIKSSDKFNPHWFDNMQKHPDLKAADKFVVYTGPTIDVEGGRALNFCDLDQLF